MRATVAAAKTAVAPPRLLVTYWLSRQWGMPLEAGGFLDQDWGMVSQCAYLDRVHTAVTKWARGRPLDPGDSKLIMLLTKQGAMHG